MMHGTMNIKNRHNLEVCAILGYAAGSMGGFMNI